MTETYTLNALIPASIHVYVDRADYESRTGHPAPVYDPDRPNCYFEGATDGLVRLDGDKFSPYSDGAAAAAGVNIPGPYAPIVPAEHGVMFGGESPNSPWYVIAEPAAAEIAASVGLPLLRYADVGKLQQTGQSASLDAFFVKAAKFYILNLGDALATKAPFGHGSPGRWVLDEKRVRIYWEPDTRINPKTLPIPYRPLRDGERLVFPPMGHPLVTVDAAPSGEGSCAEVVERLDRIEAQLGQLLMRP